MSDSTSTETASLFHRIRMLDGTRYATSYVGFIVGEKCVGQVHRTLLPLLLECYLHNKPCFQLVSQNNIIDKICNVAPDTRIVLDVEPSTQEARSAAMDVAVQLFIDKGLISKRHGELFPISMGSPADHIICVIDRNAAPFFGVTSVGVHLNCFVRQNDGNLSLWMAQRSSNKSTFPSYWDPTVAGGQPVGLTLMDNMIKEAKEEAGIDSTLAGKARSVGCLSQMTCKSDGTCLKQSLYYCWDLEVDYGFVPCVTDGEVALFELWSAEKLENEVRHGSRLRPAMRLVAADFLMRHGFITPDSEPDYAKIQNAIHKERLLLWESTK
mmetsp:Transcript_18293/g.25785  ORF Transcript_18293/g.25785 Transcript_18293/m.25785 type:complete len:325 (-) Transcript_18293:698-1672(-)